MTMTDPIADLLTRIRNGQMAKDATVEVPFSRIKQEILGVLKAEGYILGHNLNEQKPFSTLTVRVKYDADREPAIRRIRRISTPGRRVYAGKAEIPLVLGGMGINILSTSIGIMTGKKARSEGVGGEILCEVY
ncbi:MAG: 30S ribosomal protein S8 [Acidobacteriota bacterium]